MASKKSWKIVPFKSGPGIFTCFGKVVEVLAVNSPPERGVTGFSFECNSPEQAEVTVEHLRRKLGGNTPEAKALRENNSYPNAKAFVLAVLGRKKGTKKK
jgi:hypothetical protein